MRFIIDRFEEELAVVQSIEGKMINIPKDIVPSEAHEGDVIVVSLDKDESVEREIRIKEKFNRLLSD